LCKIIDYQCEFEESFFKDSKGLIAPCFTMGELTFLDLPKPKASNINLDSDAQTSSETNDAESEKSLNPFHL